MTRSARSASPPATRTRTPPPCGSAVIVVTACPSRTSSPELSPLIRQSRPTGTTSSLPLPP
eukprot:scaffold102335_cov63-Phaeocystis_antarctica.AAC.3